MSPGSRRRSPTTPRPRRAAILIAAAVVAATVVFFVVHIFKRSVDAPAAEFAGSSACAPCHNAEHAAWRGSQHSLAMQQARDGAVLGDFGDTTFTYGGVTSIFFRRGDKYLIRTDGPDGTLQDFEVQYTFGVAPLQQYLIGLPGGRLQALSIAWDTRPRERGGQHWFHLYPDERINHTDELHWTGRNQNWNFMCADCHSTNVRKGLEPASQRFQTTWSEMNVGCEACHGPGSRHMKRVAAPRWLRRMLWKDSGLTAQLTERRGVTWTIDPGTQAPKRSSVRSTNVEVEICARCHSRREQISDGYTAGASVYDYYVPALITPGLYHADGQQRDEVYTFGSFLQSRMNHAGVTCSDCHEPHGQQLRAPGNQLCVRCHLSARYDAPSHHFHRAESEGARCVSCHMPSATYMVIDPRHDHSLRIPRPDQSVALGVPNACTGCHRDRDARWAAEHGRTWWRGRGAPRTPTFAEAFHADDADELSADDGLGRIAGDASQPPIVRASALARLANRPGRVALDAARTGLYDPDPMVRRAALTILEAFPPAERLFAAPLLRDPSRVVRVQAAWTLAAVGTGAGDAFVRASEEFIQARRYNADRPEERVNLGFFFAQLGRSADAIAEYRAAIGLSPRFVPAYVNLSDLYRELGSETDAERTLREGLAAVPGDAALHHAFGLSLARTGRTSQSIEELKRAADLAPESARFIHAYAVALHSSGRVGDAIRTLQNARSRHPADRDLLYALAAFHRDEGETRKALEEAALLLRFHPDDPEAAALVRSLQGQQK